MMGFGRAVIGQGTSKSRLSLVGDDLGIAAAFVVAAVDQHDFAFFQAAGSGRPLPH